MMWVSCLEGLAVGHGKPYLGGRETGELVLDGADAAPVPAQPDAMSEGCETVLDLDHQASSCAALRR